MEENMKKQRNTAVGKHPHNKNSLDSRSTNIKADPPKESTKSNGNSQAETTDNSGKQSNEKREK